MSEAKKTGRPTAYEGEKTDRIAKALCEDGRTDAEIAEILGVSIACFYKWRIKHPSFVEALKRGKEQPDDMVEASLFRRAVGYAHKETKVFCQDGQVTTVDVEKVYPPDVTACIFWLKNRRKEIWRDKHDVEHSADQELVNTLSKVIDSLPS